jgi:hypothetical protein
MERLEHTTHAAPGFARRAAAGVAVLAALLAISELLANEAVKETIVEQTKAADVNAKRDANEVKIFQHESELFQIRLAEKESPRGHAAEQRAAKLEQRSEQQLKPMAARLESEAARHERAHNRADNRHATYEYAVVMLQVAIVLGSVAIIIGAAWLLATGGALGAIGLLLLLDGLLVQ